MADLRSPDVLVIGGGIVGTCVALHLQRSGRQVTVIERGVPGEEASGYNGNIFSGDVVPTATPGVIRSLPRFLTDPQSPLVIRPRYLPRLAPWMARFALNSLPSRVEANSIAMSSLTMRGLDAYRPLISGTAAENIFANRGTLDCYLDGGLLESDSYPMSLRKRRNVSVEVVTPDRMAELEPLTTGRNFELGVFFPNAYFTNDPGALTRALLDDFVQRGGHVLHCEATGFRREQGRVVRVSTAHDDVRPGSVVIAAGPWSRALLRQLGTNVPLDVERGYGADIPDPGIEAKMPVFIRDFHAGFAPHRGGIRIMGIEEFASIKAPANMRHAKRLVEGVRRVFPEIRVDNASLWMRRRPSMPDALPVIGRAPRCDNVWLAFGHAHKGLGTGAITGEVVRQLMDDAPTTVDVAPFRPSRFSVRESLRRPRVNS